MSGVRMWWQMVEPPPNMLLSPLPQKPRDASVDDDGRSLRGLNIGVGLDGRFLLGGAGGREAGIAAALSIIGAGAAGTADAGCKIDMVDALSAASSRLYVSHSHSSDSIVELHIPEILVFGPEADQFGLDLINHLVSILDVPFKRADIVLATSSERSSRQLVSELSLFFRR